MSEWPTSHRRSAPVRTVEGARSSNISHGYARVAEVINARGEVLRTVHYDPYAKTAPAPALKPLPENHPFRMGAAARDARRAVSLANDLRGIRPGRIVGLSAPAVAKTLARQVLPQLLDSIARGLELPQLLDGDLRHLLDYIGELYGVPLVSGGISTGNAVTPGNLDIGTLVPGTGWVLRANFTPPFGGGYSVRHRHGTSVAPWLRVSNVPLGAPNQQFGVGADATVHTNRANQIAGTITVLAAHTAREAWVMDAWEQVPWIPAATALSSTSHWRHPGPAPTPDPFTVTIVTRRVRPAPAPVPFAPFADPMLNPIGRAWVALLPVNPFTATKLARTHRRPDVSSGGYSDPGAPEPASEPRTGPVGSLPPPTGVVVETVAGGPRVPRKRDKKGGLGKLGGMLFQLAMQSTEIGDFVDALYDALPHKCPGAAGIVGKLTCLAAHWDELNVGQAVGNVIANEIEDRLIGAALGAGQKGLLGLTGRKTAGGWSFGGGFVQTQ